MARYARHPWRDFIREELRKQGSVVIISCTIKQAEVEHSHQLGIIHSESFRKAYKGIIPDTHLQGFTAERREQRFIKAISERTENTFILLLEDEFGVGFITIGENRDDDLDDTYGEIWGVYLHPDYWRKGYGRKLVEFGIRDLTKLSFRKITLWVLEDNQNTRAFYEKIGFTFDGTKKEITLGTKLFELRYILNIDEVLM